MHSGFSNMRSALPMNLKAHYPGFKVWAGAQADIDRITAIWRECLAESGGPFLFGKKPCVADAMFAPVCTRFVTYDVKLDAGTTASCTCRQGCEKRGGISALPMSQISGCVSRGARSPAVRRPMPDGFGCSSGSMGSGSLRAMRPR